MRTRMTALFALLVALLMAGVGYGVLRLERQRAQARVQEILLLAEKRAYHEIGDESKNSNSLAAAVKSEQGEISGGQVNIWVVQGSQVLWASQQIAPPSSSDDPHWPSRILSFGEQKVILAHQWTPEEEELRATSHELTILGLFVVAITTVFAWFVVGQTLSPISRLAQQAQNSKLQGLSVRLQTPSSDAEMRHLTGTLNELLIHIEREAQARARFYAAASHELRTPIQILLGEIEVARGRPRTLLEHEEVLAQLHTGTERLATLVQDLLQMNALEMRQNLAPCEQINLSFWIERALSQQTAALENRALIPEMHLVDAIIEAPPGHVEVLLRNLTENAAKYAIPTTKICIALNSSVHETTFEIYNACEVVPDTQFEEWFEPFFRPDTSRSSQTGGNGLGLAICRSICTANGWNITLKPREKGIVATVTFPKR